MQKLLHKLRLWSRLIWKRHCRGSHQTLFYGFTNTGTAFFKADYRLNTVHHWAIIVRRS